ncbi:MAG: putative quinol monooxygenase [Pseudomonadota bacterium]
MTVSVLLTIPVKPDRLDDFLALIREIAPDTRAFEGCLNFDIYVTEDGSGNVHFLEDWTTQEQHMKYSAWRVETGLADQLAPLLNGPPTPVYCHRFDG